MKFAIPDELSVKLDEIEAAARRQREAQRRAERAESEREKAIEELRSARRAELMGHAIEVFAWRDQFEASDSARRIWDVVGPAGRLQLFVARFWRGAPVPETDRTVCALLTLGRELSGGARLWYEERHKGHTSVQERILTPQGLVDAVHPDFLARAAAHLAGPDAWRYVLQQLDRLAPG